MTPTAVINLSTVKYAPGQERLRQTVFAQGDFDLQLYTHERQVGAPLHKESPYAFKPYALDKARRDGYKVLLWLDASMYVRRSISPILKHIEDHGYFFQDSEWGNERWTTPEQKAYFGTDKGTMISSGVIGLDLRTDTGKTFLEAWLQAAKDGMFNGSHEVTRHDQTAASLLIEVMGLEITPNNTYWSYGKPTDKFDDNICIIANGIV